MSVLSAIAGTIFPQPYEQPQRISTILPVPQTDENGDICHIQEPEVEQDMAPRNASEERRDEALALLAESNGLLTRTLDVIVRQQIANPPQTVVNTNGHSKRLGWIMATFAGISMLGGGAAVVSTSGVWVGNRQTELQILTKQVEELKTQLTTLNNGMLDARQKADEAATWVMTTREQFNKQGIDTIPLKTENRENRRK